MPDPIEAEQIRWQNAIDKLISRYNPHADGSGCDSGDPLDVTLAELQQTFEILRESPSPPIRED